MINLGGGWSYRVDPPHVPGDQPHIHVEYKGKEVYNQNANGKAHHP